MADILQKIVPHLWFAASAEEAALFYTSIFPGSSMGAITRYGGVGQEIHGMAPGTVMTVEFTLSGQAFMALNGGPAFRFNESISFIVQCRDQQEIDYFWDKLGEGGDPGAQACGWLKDKFGVSWQVVPAELDALMRSASPETSDKMMAALLEMKKIDLPALQKIRAE